MSSFDEVKTVYSETCISYHRIDDFRAKLLALLPTVSGVAIFFLFRNSSAQPIFHGHAAVFGFLVSVGLYFYELRGVQRCIQLSKIAKNLETEMSVNGQFTQWPHSVGRFINEPIAAAIIYSSVLSTWAYLSSKLYSPTSALILASVVFALGFIGGWYFYLHVREPHVESTHNKAH